MKKTNFSFLIIALLLYANFATGQQLMNLPYNSNRFTITDITWPANVGNAEVCLWNDDKVAAISITIDDNKEADHAWWLSMAAQYPIFTFTWFINSGVDWSVWQALINAGHDIQAHDNIAPGTGHCSINSASDQVYHDAFQAYNNSITANLTNNQIATIAYPCGIDRRDAIDDLYIAGRGVHGEMNPANGIDYMETESRSAPNDVLDVQRLLDPDVLLWNKSYYRGWSVQHYHGIAENNMHAAAEALLAAIYAERDKLWAGSFADVARYGQERDSHTLTVTNVSTNQITFTLTDQMHDTYFDFPLTVKIRVNNSWNGVSAIQNGSSVEATMVTHNGNKYALVKAVPDKGVVTVNASSTTIVNVTGVSVSPTSLNINVSQSSDLTEVVSPSNATDQSVTWSSNNTSVATVSSSGLVTGVSAGSATITVTTNDGNFTANCAVNVTQPSGSVNMALNKSITVSAFQNDAGGYKPGENLVDGDVSDDARWSASGFPQWAEIDLGAEFDLDQISLYPYQNRAYQYIIEARPASGSYSTIVNRSSNTTSADVLSDNVSTTARYVKITVSGASGYSGSWVSLAELEVYGISSTGPVPVTSVSVSPSSLSLNTGQTSDLTETVSPSNATNKSVTWSSNNTSVATVNSNGLVAAVSAGSATITVTTVDGSFTDQCSVTVSSSSVPVTGVSVSPTTLSLNTGQTSDLTETVSPSNATNKSVTWSSNNTSVASVNSSGLVTAVAVGTATITVTTNDGSFTANCGVTVSASQGQSQTITASTDDQQVNSSGSAVWVGQSTHRVGGAGSGYDGAAIIPFELPTLTAGQGILSAIFSIDLYRISNSPAGNVDIYGLPYRTTSAVNATTDFWQGTYGGDANSTAVQNDFATTSTSAGTVTTNSTGNNNLVSYINAQYTSGAQGGDYIFIRLNPDVSDVANYHYWEFYSANASAKPTLEVEIGSTSGANISSLSAKSIQKVNIYPNPGIGNNVTIEITGYDIESNTGLTLVDITGKQVFTKQITDAVTQLDVSSLNKGVYFVIVNGVYTERTKLIIQ